ncbi:phosphotransferase [Psychrobacillus psychrodurans]|uniref:phosphotransferase n=1 Tax=Psychrobacillus psychrodurans TaxID=126157 RepID=UPI0008F11A06|nr:phosphotransferase [Psychrobacillus psychrodurans]MCZ8542453.1 phosphotransferase [Psychrobacillus psychrodurans]SFN23117.1 homoserine kinase type II [Psychrobacillus psychrodurans]
MIVKKLPNDIFVELRETTECLFGIHLKNPIPINLGFLNLKWKVQTEKGLLLIKQISKERYVSYNYEEIILEQDLALREQLRQFENGTLCPRVLEYKDNVIHKSSSGERFIIMEYVDGKNLLPGTLNEKQMFSLGKMTAHMHNVSNDGTYNNDRNPKFIPPSVEQRLDYWISFNKTGENNDIFLKLVEIQIKATKQFNLDMISSCETGWSHRDLWVDNILFIGDQLSSILDFDRFAFDYPELDIARAIMSGALNGNAFNSNSAKAFLEGYKTKRNLEKGVFVRSLYLLWYLESVWWICPNLNQDRYQEVQFRNEMIWLGENLSELRTMFGSW